eukprot:CAMPEP_0182427668 /NCGR_PEP_ID=MMETSP1167-20130531/18962_1 /TAXON_ID=2988 /ORGANISM="Mallomonas Sp, Strain CCMP3275" /LENGTH=168 /DNA_ID=CAMNT_0024610073 /DNA_START=772 /DNA_END=1278 /DNA_ORIENTATION=+
MITHVELQEIIPPQDISDSMHFELIAENNRRTQLIDADAKSCAAVKAAEQEWSIEVIVSEGRKKCHLSEVQGHAEARLILARAEAQAIEIVKAVVPENELVKYLTATSYVKMLPELTKDKDSKIIVIPYDASYAVGDVLSCMKFKEKEKGSEKEKDLVPSNLVKQEKL